MNGCKSPLYKGNILLILLGALALPGTSIAETYEFKVVYAEVPGIEEIRAENYDAAIEILESRARDADKQYVADELATLCALYVLKGKFSAASVTCHDAVETDASDAAYNNRGVLLAHLGNTAGAMEDFQRARVLPANLQRYITERMRGDARLTASNNHAVATRYTARKRDSIGQSLARRVHGASVEDINY